MTTTNKFLEEESIPDVIQLEDITAESNDTSLTNNVSPEMTPKVKRRREKSLFIPLTQMDDKEKPLFLLQSNKKDLHLLRVLTLKVPWEASHGSKSINPSGVTTV